MKNLFLIFLMASISSVTFANLPEKVLLEEKGEAEILDIESLAMNCLPGIAPNGKNYPTDSILTISSNVVHGLSHALSRSLSYHDNNFGNFCKHLISTVSSELPMKLVINRKVTEICYPTSSGFRTTLVESLSAKIGQLQFTSIKTMTLGICKR